MRTTCTGNTPRSIPTRAGTRSTPPAHLPGFELQANLVGLRSLVHAYDKVGGAQKDKELDELVKREDRVKKKPNM